MFLNCFSGELLSKKRLFQWLLYFLTLNSILVFCISFKYLKYIEFDSDIFTNSYFIISYLSHFLFLSLLPLVLLGLMVFLGLPFRYLRILALSVAVIMDTSILCDAIVFELYRFHINSFVLDLLFGGAASQIFNIPALQYFISILFILIVTAVLIVFSKLSSYLINRNLKLVNRIYISLFFLFLVSSHLIHAWADAAAYQPITKISRFYPLYFPLRAPDLFYESGIVDKTKIKENKIKFINKSSKDLNYPLNAIELENQNNPNIIMIVLDSWHHKTLDSIISPNIYNFALKSQWFKNHNSGSNGTRGGIFSLFYGIPALYWEDVQSTATAPVFITSLQKTGYDFSINASSALSSPPFDRTVFSSIPDLKLGSEGKTSCDRDLNLTNNFIHYIDSINQMKAHKPFFAFLFYDAPHAIEHPDTMKCKFLPEWPNPKYLSLNINTDPTPFFNLYKNAVHFDDILIGRVLQKLERTGYLKNSIVVITGDHGQEFNDNRKNFWGHNGNFTRAQIGVPLVVYIPDKKPETFDYRTLHYDITPTLMNLALGCKNEISDYSCGKNLFDSSERNRFIVGSRENFGIVDHDKIITVFPNGNFSITDKHMNELNNSKIDHNSSFQLITEINRFYKTEKKS